MIENSAQVSGTIGVDAVREVLDSCILESTKTKNINQAILYIIYAMKCAGSDDKKDLDNDFFVEGMLEKVQNAYNINIQQRNTRKTTTASDSSLFF